MKTRSIQILCFMTLTSVSLLTHAQVQKTNKEPSIKGMEAAIQASGYSLFEAGDCLLRAEYFSYGAIASECVSIAFLYASGTQDNATVFLVGGLLFATTGLILAVSSFVNHLNGLKELKEAGFLLHISGSDHVGGFSVGYQPNGNYHVSPYLATQYILE